MFEKKRGVEKKKKNDIVLIVLILLLSGVSLIAVKSYQKQSTHEAVAVVTVDGKEYGRYSLKEDTRVTISQGENENVLVIQDGYADIVSATCPDKICVRHAKINGNGQTMVCLPNKVVVEIVNQDEETGEVDLSTN